MVTMFGQGFDSPRLHSEQMNVEQGMMNVEVFISTFIIPCSSVQDSLL